MKLPKGFGKNYFSLSAITATVNEKTMHSVATCVKNYHVGFFTAEELDAELEEEVLELVCALELSQKPCHCNRYFFKRTRKTLQLFFNQNLFFNYFKTLNNSISPPLFLLSFT